MSGPAYRAWVPTDGRRQASAARTTFFGSAPPWLMAIRYRESSDGETYIQRRRRGWLLLRTVIFPPSKLKFT
jgi:hypothetical protein